MRNSRKSQGCTYRQGLQNLLLTFTEHYSAWITQTMELHDGNGQVHVVCKGYNGNAEC